MFSHDPFQSYQTLGAYGTPIPYGAYQGIPAGIHPLALAGLYGPYPQTLQGGFGIGQQGPWQQAQGLNPPGIGIHNPLLQNPQAQAGMQQSPFQQNPFQQNPFQQNPFQQNPLHQNSLVNPMLAYQQMLAHQLWQQPQTPFPYPLPPQTLMGQGIGQPGLGIGQPYGQLNPWAQVGPRQFGYY